MFSNFYPSCGPGDAASFAEAVAANCDSVSAAQIQGFFMFFKRSHVDALENAYRLWTPPPEKK